MKFQLRKYKKILEKIKEYKEEYKDLSNAEISKLTGVFRERYENGETLEHMLPEAVAAICEADFRVLGMYPYDAQIYGGLALFDGYLAEMNTGEGKTLVATIPLFVNAITKKGGILVTTNEYLATRDAEQMGKVYRFMGLTVAAGVNEDSSKHFTNEEKKRIYASDIVYTTHSALGFDYLFHNLVTSPEERFLRELSFVIVDEADSVLLDSAEMPLVISGAPRVQSNLYDLANFFVTTLKEETDYEKEEKKVWLTEEGVRKAECFFQIDNFYGSDYSEINRYVELALRAHKLYEKGKEYVVSDEGEVVLLDGQSGRVMPGVKLRGGQHQAIEVKEKITASKETRSVATITYQNLFLLFDKMAGMSGTISDARDELRDVYNKKVLIIPPNKKLLRQDLPDLYFEKTEDQFAAALDDVLRTHKTGQPVLVVVSTIEETETVSQILLRNGVAHNVLNANNAFWEASIIKEAGQKDAVTVATSMAGRGTDIKLGKGVPELGGLHVVGIGRMVNVRVERQARGRAGRQGDPGQSQFYVSLQDDIVVKNGPESVQEKLEAGKKFSKKKCRHIIDKAQSLGEERAVQSRKRSVEYDQVLQQQRRVIYDTRKELLDGNSLGYTEVMKFAEEKLVKPMAQEVRRYQKAIKKAHQNPEKAEALQKELNRWFRGFVLDNLSDRLDEKLKDVSHLPYREVEKLLMYVIQQEWNRQQSRISNKEEMNDFVRRAVLKAIDDAWVEEVDYLGQLQYAVMGRSYAQRNPVYEFEKEAYSAFHEMQKQICRDMIRNINITSY